MCPQLGDPTGVSDVARQNFSARLAGYSDLEMTVVAPARWLHDCAQKSALLGAFPCETIPCSVDPYIFTAQPQSWTRVAFGLPQDRKILAFGASGVDRWNKGLHILKHVLKMLRPQWHGKTPVLLIFGHGDMQEMLPQGYECFTPGWLTPSELAKAYSSADVFVSASLQEAFGLVTAEAQACGTPCVGFRGTGAEDIIQDGVTGYLAEHPGLPLTADGRLQNFEELFDPARLADFAEKIQTCLELPEAQASAMRKASRECALREFSPVLHTGRYLCLYRRILGLPEITIEGLPE